MNKTKTTKEQYDRAIQLKFQGYRICDIAKELGLKRSNINNWINGGHGKQHNGTGRQYNSKLPENTNPIEYLKSLNPALNEATKFALYSFVLGLYLGDGCISKSGKNKRFALALDKKYPSMNDYILKSLEQFFNSRIAIFDKSIDRGQKGLSNSIEFRYSNNNLGILFPHEGVGAKHLRKIELKDWQKEILNSVEFVRGLIYSDGCYYFCKTFKKNYYNFANCSLDIIEMLEENLTKLDIRFNRHQNKKLYNKGTALKYSITVSYQDDVNKLHDMIGDKKFSQKSFLALPRNP